LKKISNSWLLLLCLSICIKAANADLLDDEDESSVVMPIPAPMAPEKKPASKSTPKAAEKSPEGSDNKVTPQNAPTQTPKKSSVGPGVKNKKGEVGAPREPVHFESKGLRGLRDKGTVELLEDVIITQGELRVEADKAKIFYDEDQREVARVLAEGNVKIFNVERSTGEKMQAFSNQMEFLNKNRTVIMEGNARLWRGTQSVIRGKKITYEIDSGWIKADRVAGELQPEDKKK